MMKRISRVGLALLSMVMMYTLLSDSSTSFAAKEPTIAKPLLILTVRSSLNATSYSTLKINSPDLVRALSRPKKEKLNDASLLPDLQISLLLGQEGVQLRMERSGNLWNEATREHYLLPQVTVNRLRNYAAALRNSHYGRLTRWDDAKNIVNRKSMFSVTDLETGLTFKVQRRAGSSHADVQPLTKEDTAIMKQIYNGRWSWKRKPIIVHSSQGRLAASMNGMPHGGDGIPDNDFSGHFCIHFQDSTSHKSNTPDPAHQLMIHKAAGNLRSYLDAASPDILAESFIEAMYQQDEELLSQVWVDAPKDKLAGFIRELQSLTSIRIRKPSKKSGQADQENNQVTDDRLLAEIKLPVAINVPGKPERNSTYTFRITRESPQLPWRIVDVRS
ncbi:hypothetical protein [Cohnella abietis]|nr:hypothetical protein [Cohnella abietis]